MELIDSFNRHVKSSFGGPPSSIYHYTGADGLMGLVQSGKIWVTKASYLNDPAEEVYGREIISEVLLEEANIEGEGETVRFLKGIARNIKDGNMDCATDFYLSSFSEEKDDLAQWIAYGQDGWGYSLELSVGEQGISSEHILPVIYNRYEQIELVKKIIASAIEFLRERNPTPNTFNSVYLDIVPVFKLLLICMKQEAYAHEKEWRLVFSPNNNMIRDDLKFREGKNGTVVPYVPLNIAGDNGPLEKLPLKSVILGPQRENDHVSLELLLSKNSYPKGLKIENSSIRYRS